MRRAAGFHGDGAGLGQRLGPAFEGGAPQDLAVEHGAVGVEHADGENTYLQTLRVILNTICTAHREKMRKNETNFRKTFT